MAVYRYSYYTHYYPGEQFSSDVQYMSDSDSESLSEDFFHESSQEAQDNPKANFEKEGIDTEEVPKEDTKFSRNVLHEAFNEMSSAFIFPEAELTIRDVSLMVIGLCIRFNLTYVVRQALFNLVKCLAGRKFKDWNTSKFKISKMYDPLDESINLSFFCVNCYCPLLPPISKINFTNCDVTSLLQVSE